VRAEVTDGGVTDRRQHPAAAVTGGRHGFESGVATLNSSDADEALDPRRDR